MVSLIVTGGKEFHLQYEGLENCAVSYQGGFVTIGGYSHERTIEGWSRDATHGKVDRWKNKISVHFCVEQGMTVKASTLVRCLIFWKQDLVMPALPSHPPRERRFMRGVN